MRALGFLLLFSTWLATAPSASASVRISPASFSFDVKPSQRAVQRVSVTNTSALSARFGLEIQDVDHTESGERRFLTAGTATQGCGRWIGALPPFVTIAPGKSMSVEVIAKVPAGLAPGSYMCAFTARRVEAHGPPDQRKAAKMTASVAIVPSVASLMTFNLTNEEGERTTSIDIVDATIKEPTPSTPLVVRVKVANASSFVSRPSGTVSILGDGGRIQGTFSIDRRAVYPRNSTWLEATFGDTLKPGQYQIIVAVADESGGNAVADFVYDAFPPAPPKPVGATPKKSSTPSNSKDRGR